MKVKYYSIIVSILICSLFLFSCSTKDCTNNTDKTWERIQNHKVMRVGTDFAGTPFSFKENGEYVGFEIELIKAVAKELGVDVEFTGIPFGVSNFENALAEDKVDVIIESITKLKSRTEKIGFSDSYFVSGQAVLVKKSEVVPDKFELSMLSDKKVGVEKGTTGCLFAKSYLKSEILEFDTTSDQIKALLDGKVYAIINDILSTQTTNWPLWKDIKVILKNLTQEQYCIIANKNSTTLLSKINKAISKLKEDPVDGVYSALYRKWFY